MVPSGESAPRVTPPFGLREAIRDCLPDVDQDVAVLHLSLLHLGRIVESSIQTLLVPEGLEISEHSVLSALWFAGPPHTMSPTQLSQVILQTTSGMSKTLRRVESLGLIERVADPADGRARLVVLTTKGRDLAERHLRQLVDQWGAGLQGAASAEVSNITKAVFTLVAHLDPTFEISAAD
ncbi:MAG: MarR family transcriptional regulator [Aeromicrobium sp.]|nr:MarR family transcriptional regulator [Aeromicrobium sp.]